MKTVKKVKAEISEIGIEAENFVIGVEHMIKDFHIARMSTALTFLNLRKLRGKKNKTKIAKSKFATALNVIKAFN